MAKRKPLTKGRRFDVFRRDGFVCHYCGRQPPEAVLQVDHIRPVAEGGANDLMNLITSCRDCNLGKGKKLLDNPQRPDADLSWLEMQQEVAELRDYQLAKQRKDELMAEVVLSLQQTWFDHSGLGWCPGDATIRKMMLRYSPQIVEQALATVAVKEAGGYFTNSDGWFKYIWAVMRNMVAEG